MKAISSRPDVVFGLTDDQKACLHHLNMVVDTIEAHADVALHKQLIGQYYQPVDSFKNIMDLTIQAKLLISYFDTL